MVHSREDSITCGPIMPQGGIQALEAMLYTLDQVNKQQLLPNVTLGAHLLDDCDKDTYGLEMAVDFIKGFRVEAMLVPYNSLLAFAWFESRVEIQSMVLVQGLLGQ
ncbi:GD10162 [Drosophila simulans]|uniref:GD10162 n=1 Tax=Drosophila simulans TaxID=7240 RepID=B4QFT4_DROSI|nr:GD10162 [Drosophila simulans]